MDRTAAAPIASLLLGALALAGCSETFVTEGKAPVAADTADTAGLDSADSADTADSAAPDDSGEPPDTGETGDPPVDEDGDGFAAPRDCDDADAAVHPGANETWYDGVDQDCDGNDDDQDRDGAPVASDCDDLDPARAPGNVETWYDGVDQDCDGNDDDQDADGAPALLDCDDTDGRVHPGATELWYDGVDQDCDGANDHDQDADGDPAASGGGSDCDDTDPLAYTGNLERLGDASDGDCDGDADSPAFQSLDTFSATGMQGPRLATISGYVVVTFLADTLLYGASPMATGAALHLLDDADPLAGSLSDSVWEWGTGYSFDDGVDFWADDDDWVWAYGLHSGSARYLLVDDYNVAASAFGNTAYSRSTTSTFDDVELLEATDGSLHVVGCDNQSGYLTWMHGSPGDFYRGTPDGSDDVSGAVGDSCSVWTPDAYVYLSKRSSGAMSVYRYSDSAGLSSVGTSSPWNAYDTKTDVASGNEAWVTAEGTNGLYVYLDGNDTSEWVTDARAAAVAFDTSGRMYVAVADSSTTAWLLWGDPARGFDRVELDHGLLRADDVDVVVTDGDLAIVAVRGGNDVAFAAVRVP